MSLFSSYSYEINGNTYNLQDSICFQKILCAITTFVTSETVEKHPTYVILTFTDMAKDHIRGKFAKMDNGTLLFLYFMVNEDCYAVFDCIEDCLFNIYRFSISFGGCNPGAGASFMDLSKPPPFLTENKENPKMLASTQSCEEEFRKEICQTINMLISIQDESNMLQEIPLHTPTCIGYNIDYYWTYLFDQETKKRGIHSLSLFKRGGRIFMRRPT
ncbi:MAG: hypothetical protein Sylvanvirus20_2 [Sylvanvirus sp.]|uniref:Uncharacterized protein n=1 Tax=Sylvanvirus sp. TaxID=2487774 RepID=A0A3G5AIK6_9VIRU|nr:MAG: hypothetical protein Sylvanvirus20_2 [Sylvanvirus sp.]